MSNPVRDAYERWARTYDTMVNATRDLDEDCLRKALSDWNLGEVLELGCGTGKNTKWLVKQGKVMGLDFSKEMLSICRRVAPSAELHIADLTLPWPVKERAVDAVIASLVLEHIEALDHIAIESARVLKIGGRVRVSELHPWRGQRGKGARFEDKGQWVSPPSFVHTKEAYLSAFQSAGFTLDECAELSSPGASPSDHPRLIVMSFSLPAQ